mmetsp:Transcript_40697/g.69458  ORF Transcript_40697/g.69458 Transcript_40697/m.69458 type:complete len:278 (-) Transcript_40697:169-1002(-)
MLLWRVRSTLLDGASERRLLTWTWKHVPSSSVRCNVWRDAQPCLPLLHLPHSRFFLLAHSFLPLHLVFRHPLRGNVACAAESFLPLLLLPFLSQPVLSPVVAFGRPLFPLAIAGIVRFTRRGKSPHRRLLRIPHRHLPHLRLSLPLLLLLLAQSLFLPFLLLARSFLPLPVPPRMGRLPQVLLPLLLPQVPMISARFAFLNVLLFEFSHCILVGVRVFVLLESTTFVGIRWLVGSGRWWSLRFLVHDDIVTVLAPLQIICFFVFGSVTLLIATKRQS